MLPADPPLEAVEEVHELNRMFLAFLRDSTDAEVRRFGLPPVAADALRLAPAEQFERAAGFPRALFRLRIPGNEAGSSGPPVPIDSSHREQVLRLVLLHSARSFSRSSGYWARLLLGLEDSEVSRLRAADVSKIVMLSRQDGIVRAAFDATDWIWPELFTETRPEYRRRLLLIGFQPELSPGYGAA